MSIGGARKLGRWIDVSLLLRFAQVWLFHLFLLRNLLVVIVIGWSLPSLVSWRVMNLFGVLVRHRLLVWIRLAVVDGWASCVVHVVQVSILLHLVGLKRWQSHACMRLPALELNVLELKLLDFQLELIDLVSLHPHLFLSLAFCAHVVG